MISQEFWGQIIKEHGINEQGFYEGTDPEQLFCLDSYFVESRSGLYIPRTICIDGDPVSLDTIRQGRMGELFHPELCIYGSGCAENNYALGVQRVKELEKELTMKLRNVSEAIDKLQGLQWVHSLGGGTGSGYTPSILEMSIDIFGRRVQNILYSVIPSPRMSNGVLEPYNTILALKNTDESPGLCFMVILDNQGLYDISTKNCKITKPTYDDFNFLIGNAMSGITCSHRFAGLANHSMRKFTTALVPNLRMKYIMTGFAPLYAKKSRIDSVMLSAKNLLFRLINTNLYAMSGQDGLHISSATIFRGYDIAELDHCVMDIQKECKETFVPWMANQVQASICPQPHWRYQECATILSNKTSIAICIEDSLNRFKAMSKKKAYFHQFTEFGMDELSFNEAELDIADLIHQYHGMEGHELDEVWHKKGMKVKREEKEKEKQEEKPPPAKKPPAEAAKDNK